MPSKACNKLEEDVDVYGEYYIVKSLNRRHGKVSYDGHTLRRVYLDDNTTNPVLTRMSGFSSFNQDTYGLLPVTEVDFFFDRGYVEANFLGGSRFRPIKEALQSSDIIRTLESLAVSKETSFCRRTCRVETFYEIPICGHYVPLTLDQMQEEGSGPASIFAGKQEFIPNQTKRPLRSTSFANNHLHEQWRLNGGKPKKKLFLSSNTEGLMDKSKWLYYQGKYWDPSLLYVFRPTIDEHVETQTRMLGVLHKVCPLSHTKAFQARIQLGPVKMDTTTVSSGDIESQQKKKLTAAMVRKQFEKIQGEAVEPEKDSSVLHRLMVKSFYDRSTARGPYSQYYTQKKTVRGPKHLEIDLGEVCSLTHIGFLGGFPHFTEIKAFPPVVYRIPRMFQTQSRMYQQRLQERQYLGLGTPGPRGRYSRRTKRGRQRQVQIVSEDALSWVKRFTMQYRDVMTNKWCDFPQEFEGNVDIVHEKRHRISLHARFIRVIPKDFHRHRDFSVLLYGYPITPSGYACRMNSNARKSTVKKSEISFHENYTNLAVATAENIVVEKKPLNISAIYDLVKDREMETQQTTQNMHDFHKANRGHDSYTTRRIQKNVRNILGKKVETIRYELKYHMSYGYNENTILHDEDYSQMPDHESMENRRKKNLGGSTRFHRLPQGQGYRLYHDLWGEPSEWQVRESIKKNMMEDFRYYHYFDEYRTDEQDRTREECIK